MAQRLTYPQVARAQGAHTAYTTVQDWLSRLSHDEIMERLAAKIAEKAAVLDEWTNQHKETV